MPDGLDKLPPYLQVIATMFIVVVTGAWAFLNYTKPFLDKLAKAPAKAGSTDAVVVSGAFADGKPIRELEAQVKSLAAIMADVRDATRENTVAERDTGREVGRLADRVNRVGDILSDRLPTP